MEEKKTVRLRVSPEVARIVGKSAPREVKVMAARGALPLQGSDLVTTLFLLANSKDDEVRRLALERMRVLPPSILQPVLAESDILPELLDYLARLRLGDQAVMEPLLTHPAVPTATLAYVARHGEGPVLSLVACNDQRLMAAPEIVEAILANPRADRALKFRFGWQEPEATAPPAAEQEEESPEPGSEEEEDLQEEEDVHQSKYQMALEMGVSEKIKMALTGDKEWRSIFLKDANKLVSSAVMKNPRITEGEVVTVAKNKSTSEELIRLITLNREWVKNYEVKKALVLHPRTPLPTALRYMNVLSEKDLKSLAKSRGVSQVLVNNARRMLMAKEKKG